MSTYIPTIRSFLTEGEAQFLKEQIKETTIGDYRLVSADAAPEHWLQNAGGDNSIIAIPLHHLTFDMPEGWVKYSITERYSPGSSIIFRNVKNETPVIRRLREPLSVFFKNEGMREQCLNQFPHWSVVEDPNDAEAEVCPSFGIKEDLPVFHFDPIELIPTPSSGIICLVGRENDRDAKRWCRQLMDRDTVMCSNLEREIERIKQENLPDASLFVFSRKTGSGFETAAALHSGDRWSRCLETFSSTAGAAHMLWKELCNNHT